MDVAGLPLPVSEVYHPGSTTKRSGAKIRATNPIKRGSMANDEHRPQTVEPEEGELAPNTVIDLQQFGRRLRALRIMAGYDRASDFVTVLRSRYGIDCHDRTVYAIERGEQMPGLDFTMACFAILTPDPGFFAPALRPDIKTVLERSRW